ncbi:MAG: class I SAM-dependent methyltransferase [Anaerolineaceae bacterium]|nr:class I SAM-dependent methyltransferase [Anaerolineaceae bacterium]
MSVYQHFAKHYHHGPYTLFTEKIINEVFPHWLEVLDFQPASVLDLACGSGEFAIAQAKAGLAAVGLDQSKALLKLAEQAARQEGVKPRWVQGNMSHFVLPERFDCVTCWFDSLNYLSKIEELANCFKQSYAHLNPKGYFLFDMNSIYGIVVKWQQNKYFIQQETPDYLEICANSCDYENNIAEMRLIMFEREGQVWKRHEEIHQERGYAVDDILLLLENAGFSVRHLLGNPLLMRPLEAEDSRLWIAAQK